MKPTGFARIARVTTLVVLTLSLAASTTGCLGARLRDRYRANEGSFSDAPSLPKADFGRAKAPMQQTGTDRRAREIEASLGVGN